MEGSIGGSRLVVTELSHIKDLAVQLEKHLDGPNDRCRNLVSQIFSLTERSIGMVTSTGFNSGRKLRPSGEHAAGLASATPSPLGDVPSKKRKTMRKRQVKEAEGGREPVDDCHGWRKYGQKPILGARYPRSYYRCRHRHTHGCRAMKKVQRNDEDPTLFDVIYYFAHTCVERTPEAEAGAGQLIAPPPPEQVHGHPDDDAHSCLVHGLTGGLTVKTEEEGLAAAAATDPQGWNGSTTPFDNALSTSPVSWGMLSPATSDVADEFLDIDVISSFFD